MKYCITLALLQISLVFLGQNPYQTNGSAAALPNDCYRITPNFGSQTGSVWYTDQIDLTQAFDLRFQMNFGNNDGGADGMVFVMQNDGIDALGQLGGGLGFEGFEPSFGIEFDTWQNTDNGDPIADHIGFHRDGNVEHNSATSLSEIFPIGAGGNIEDGQNHEVRVSWDPATTEISFFFDCVLVTTETIDLCNDIFDGLTEVFWGFTGSTGGAFNEQVVCLAPDILGNTLQESICSGGSITLGAAGNPDGEYEWTPGTFLDDVSSPNPICTPETDITYNVVYSDGCGFETMGEVNVSIEELEINVVPAAVLTCNQPTTQVSVGANFTSDLTYSWVSESGGFIGNTEGMNATVSGPGLYEVTVLFQGQCAQSETLEVEENVTTFEMEVVNEVVLNCEMPTATIPFMVDGAEIGDFTINSLENAEVSLAPSFSIAIDQPGIYEYVLTNIENGCAGAPAVIEVEGDFVPPTVNIGEFGMLSCENPVLTFSEATTSPAEGIFATWTTSNGNIVSDNTLLGASVNLPGEYAITILNTANGCTASAFAFVDSDEYYNIDISGISLPNVITPNADAFNEQFKLYLPGNSDFDISPLVERFDLKVYNRYGVLVYESASDAAKSWNGLRNGSESLSPGTYFYVLDYKAACNVTVEEERKGNITVLE